MKSSFSQLSNTAKTVESIIRTTLGDALKKRLSIIRMNKALQILPVPNGWSDDLSMLNVNYQLSGLKTKTTIENGMLAGDTVRGDFAIFRQLAGYVFNPLGSIPVREPKKPADSRYLSTLSWFALKCAGFIKKDVRIDLESTTGYSQGVKAHAQYKTHCFMNFDNKLPSLLQMSDKTMSNGEFFIKTLDLGVEHANVEGRRTQAEKIDLVSGVITPKIREVYDCFGKKVKVDRTTPFDGFYAMRSRLVYGSSATFNYGLSYYGTGWRAYYFNKFPTLFKHNMLTLGDKIGDRINLVSIDFANFDQNMDQSYTDALFDSSTHFAPSLIRYIKRCLGFPMIVKNDYLGGKGIYIKHHDVECGKNVYGNPSGLTFVSDIAKIVGSSVALTLLLICFDLNLEQLEVVIEGNHPLFLILNGGDDNLFCFKKKSDKIKFENFVTAHSADSGYSIEIEKTPIFLGHDLIQKGTKIKAIQDVRNLALKIQLAEQTIGRGKPFYKLGFWLRQELLKDHPFYNEFFKLYEDMIKKATGVGFSQLFNVDKTPLNTQFTNLADVYFMENPEYIYYRLDPDEVSKELLDNNFLSISSDKVKKMNEFVKSN